MGEGTEKPEDVEEPEDHGDHNDTIENGLDGALHRDEPVYKPEQDAHGDENQNNVDEGHETSLAKRTGLEEKLNRVAAGRYRGNGGGESKDWCNDVGQ